MIKEIVTTLIIIVFFGLLGWAFMENKENDDNDIDITGAGGVA